MQHSSPFLLLLLLLLSRAPSVCLRALSKELYLSVGYNSPASARREGGRRGSEGSSRPSESVEEEGGTSAAIVQMRGRIGTGRKKDGRKSALEIRLGTVVATLSQPIL